MPRFVSWIPTKPEYIDSIFELALVRSSDVVYDLGSGDGRLLFAALEKGAGKCVGIDIDPERVNVAREAAKNRGIDNKITFIKADFMEQDLSAASLILCYLWTSASTALRPKLEKELQPGTRVVMESFPIPGWKPTKTKEINGKSFHLYIMPPEKTTDYESILSDSYEDYNWVWWI